ncbi:hypothetical protein [Sporosarcina sp. FSL K6-1508]|uniref:hypothetical protein n=1 Tax=Sporosarcina sp. FSL K6-1508 TaxID=2921553 RepID=UPI0030F7417E
MTKNNNFEQTDIFKVFGLIDDHAEKKKQEEAERAAKARADKEEYEAKAAEIRKKTSVTTPRETVNKKDVETFTPNEDTIIRYYGETFEITSFLTSEELAEGFLVKKNDETERIPLEPEMLRKRMEKEFPELVKAHTEIIFLKDKNIIIPTMKAKKKGNCENVLSSDSTSPFLSKIPFSILQEFISLSKIYGELSLEVHGDIYYCIQKHEYFLDIPKQSVHRLWAEVTEESLSIVERVQDAIKVLEIHSHHSMRPLPSPQDDESERVPGMHYAIVGYIHHYLPEVFLRQFVSEDVGHIRKDVISLFECPFQTLPSFEIESIEVNSK